MAFTFDANTAKAENTFDPSTAEVEKPAGMLRKVADKGIGFASGAVGATKAIADAAGAGNAVSGALGDANKFLNDNLSDEAKADQSEQSAIMDSAKGKGVWEGVKAGAKAFGVAPVQTAVQGLGSIVPVLAGGVAGLPGAIVTGAAIGAGTAKGAIYDEIKKRGGTEEDATRAQEYGGVNTDQIALGGVLGVADAATGVSRIAGGMVRNALGKPVAQAAVQGVERGVIGRAGMGMLGEMPLEAAQGGQEQVAANIAAQRAGYQAGTWDNVASNATLEALASAGPGAAFGAFERHGSPTKHVTPEDQPAKTEPLQIGNTLDPMISFADGTVGRQSEVDKYISGLPSDQQPAARAKLMGLAPQPASQATADQTFVDPATGLETTVFDGGMERTYPAAPKPSESMGLAPTDAPSLTNAAIIAVDTGASQPVVAQATPEADPVQSAQDEYRTQTAAMLQQQDEQAYKSYMDAIEQSKIAQDEAPGETVAAVAPIANVLSNYDHLSDDEFFAQLGATPQEIADAIANQPSSPQASASNPDSTAPDVATGQDSSAPAVDAKQANLARIKAANVKDPAQGTDTSPTQAAGEAPKAMAGDATTATGVPTTGSGTVEVGGVAKTTDSEQISAAVAFADRAGLEGQERKKSILSDLSNAWGMTADEVADVADVKEELKKTISKEAKAASIGRFVEGVKQQAIQANREMVAAANNIPDTTTGAPSEATQQPAQPVTVEGAGASQPTQVASIDQAAHAAATSPLNDLPQPTDGQKKAGNYAKGHVMLGGLDLSIENPAGSVRSGKDKSGKPWSNTLQHHYGYIKGTMGNDKDHVDLFVKPETPLDYSGDVFVIDQVHPETGKFDEHKVMVGFPNILAAKTAYLKNYAKGWKGMKAVTPMAFSDFKIWVKAGPKNIPLHKDTSVSQPTEKTSAQATKTLEVQAERPPQGTPEATTVKPTTTAGVATTDAVRGANPEYRTDIVMQPTVASPVHQDPGKAPEVATAPVVSKSIAKAASNEDKSQKEMRLWLLGEIDKAVKLTEDYADYQQKIKEYGQSVADSVFYGKANGSVGLTTPPGNATVTFDVPGDGKFKIRNSLRGLMEFRAKVEGKSGTGFTDKPTKPKGLPASTGVAKGSSNQIEALSNMLEEMDFEAAVDYARETGVSLNDAKVAPHIRDQLKAYLKDGTLPPAPFSPTRYWEYQASSRADQDGNPIREASLTKEIGADTYIANVTGTNATGFTFTVTKGAEAFEKKSGTYRTFSDALQGAESKINSIQPEVVKPKDTGWNMAGVGFAGKRYRGRNITLDDGREVVARIYENAGQYEEAEVKVDGARVFAKTDRHKAEKLADDFIATLTAKSVIAPVERPKGTFTYAEIAGIANASVPYVGTPNRITMTKQKGNIVKFLVKGGMTEARAKQIVEDAVTYQAMQSRGGTIMFLTNDNLRQVMKNRGLVFEESAPAAVQAEAPAEPDLDLKGFTRTPKGNGEFDLVDGNLYVTVKPTAYGFQANHGMSAKSGPRLTEQQAIEWAAALRDESKRIQAREAKPAEPAKTFRNPDTLNVLHAPIEDKDWFKLKNGEEWQARQGYSGRGWSLVRNGNLHPEARNFESQSDFIRSVIEVTGQTQAAGQPRQVKRGDAGYADEVVEATEFIHALAGSGNKSKSPQEGWSRYLANQTFKQEVLNEPEFKDLYREIIDKAPLAPETQANDEPIPAITEAQARKQFEWRNMGQKDGTKSHMLFFFESPADKGTGASLRRGEVSLYPGASGWKLEDGDGTAYKSLADAKAAAIDAAIPILQEQGYILKPAAAATAILDAANITGKERVEALKDVKKGDITPEELEAAYPASAGKFEQHNAIAQEYGYTVADDGSIALASGKESGVKVILKGSRFQIRGKSTDDIVYSGATVDSMGKFLESFWGAEKEAKEAKPAAQESAQPAQEATPTEDGIVVKQGKGFIKDKFLSEVDGDGVPGGPFDTEDAAREAAEAWRAKKADRATESAAERARRDVMAERIKAGAEPTANEIKSLDLGSPESDIRWFFPTAANLFGLTSRQIRPMVATMIRVASNDMGTKRELVPTKNALMAIGRTLADAKDLQSSTKEEAETRSASQESTTPAIIEDTGVKLGGARKDQAPSLKTELSDDDISSKPLSKIWPADEYLAIDDTFASAVAFVARQEVPSKPRAAHRVAQWVKNLKTVRHLAQMISGGEVTQERFAAKVGESSGLRNFMDKVVLLEAIDRSQWPRISSVEVYKDAYMYAPDGTKVSKPIVRVVIDDKTRSFDGAMSVADVVERVSAMLDTEVKQDKRMQFEVRGTEKKGYGINKKGDKEYRRLKTFPTAKEAFAYIAGNYDDVVALWDGVKERDNVKEDDVRNSENRPRSGADHRQGKDVSAEQFNDTFGFRGIEFGNWVSQGKNAKDRQGMLNQAYDALRDLSDIIGVPPKAMSLNGSLGLGFGSRGSGKFAAHFETDALVINLTKTRGAGSLAHEWLHAMDNYFARQRHDGKGVSMAEAGNTQDGYRKANYVTYKPEPMYVHKTKMSTPTTKAKLESYAASSGTRGQAGGYYDPENWQLDPKHPQGVRPEVERRFAELVEALDASPMATRASMNDKAPDGYWGRIIERAARSFENYVISKMLADGYQNDYLANVRDVQDFQRDAGRYPYLLPEEVAPIAEAFDNLFGTIQTKETEQGIAMFSQGLLSPASFGPKPTPDQIQRLVDKVLQVAKNVIPVSVIGNPSQIAGIRVPAGSKPKGALIDGRIYLFTDNIQSIGDAYVTLFHELFHLGLQKVIPAEDYAAMLRQFSRNVLVQKYVREWKDSPEGVEKAAKMPSAAYEALAAEEAMAMISEELSANSGVGTRKLPGLVKTMLSWFAGAADRLGFPVQFGVWMRKLTQNAAEKFVTDMVRASTGGDKNLGKTQAKYGTTLAEMTAQTRLSDGKATNQTDSMAFKAWFSGSKVVDAQGKPLVVYHGTGAEFTVFDAARTFDGGFYFTPKDDYAEEFGAMKTQGEIKKIAAYLSIKEPLEIYAEGMPFDEDMQNRLMDEIQRGKMAGQFDGIVVRNLDALGYGEESDMWIAFRPEQIKSATGNNGDFDPKNPDIRFSQGLGHALNNAANNVRDGLNKATVTDLKHQFGNRLADFRGLGLQTLGRRQLVDLYAGDLPQMESYSRMVAQMDADKNESGAEADALATGWGKLKDERQLAELMHDATLAQIDPDKAFVDGDDQNFYDALRDGFTRLTPEAKAAYRKARDMYSGHNDKVRDAIRERIMRSEMSSAKKQALLTKMDGEFFKKVKGVYFPLARFGQYVTIVKDSSGNVLSANRSETMNEAEATRKILLAKFPASGGYKVGKVLKDKEFNAARDGVGRGFMADLFETLDKTNAGDELTDAISQLYLAALPDLSWAKHGIHRKGTPGFSQDARRAFAQNMFHGARYLAKLRYADQLQTKLDDMQEHIVSKADVAAFDSVKAQQVVDEMVKRHDSMMNPATNPISTALTSFGFVFHLGLSPASALVNLSQTALVAYPVMGAKWGFGKASAALMNASRQAAGNKNDISKALSGEELEAYNEAVRAGVIDVTMAHDLAGIAQGEDSKVSAKIRPVMKAASFLFHHAEKFNRQVTFVAAYRLAKESGAGHLSAYDQAVKATYDGHFDYSACVDDQTEILTLSGWKKRVDLLVGDTAIATDSEGKAVESKVTAVNVYEGDREVIEFQSSRSFNMVLTPNHDAIVQNYSSRDKKWQSIRKVQAGDLKNHHFIVRAPLAAIERSGSGMGEDMATLLGWIAAEGWYSKYRKTTEATDVRLAQSNTHNPEYLTEISELLTKMGGDFKAYTYKRAKDTLTTFVLRRSLGRQIQQYMPNKMLTAEMLSTMSTMEMRGFLMAFLKGDGTQYKNGTTWCVGQKAGANLDVLQAMATMCGMRSTLSKLKANGMRDLYVVVNDEGCRSHVRPLTQIRRTEPLVWCPTTEHGTWIARRNGTVFVTGNSNRPRVMQGNVAKVVLLFKQYAQNMVYTLTRQAQLSLNGATPAERAEARKALGGLLVSHALAAGALGLPMVGMLLSAASMIGGDDDEPWDAKAALQNMLADTLGQKPAEVFAHGLSRLTPWDISGRVGLDKLLLPDVQEGLEGADAVKNWMAAALGPVAGIAVNAGKGMQDIANGQYARGLESMLPSALRAPLKAYRYGTEGNIDKTGVAINEEIGAAGVAGQALGFSPSEARLAQEGKSAIYSADRAIQERRSSLTRQFALAAMAKDQEGMADARKDIVRFNEKNPKARITPINLMQSVRARRKRIEQAEQGVYLPKKRQDAIDAGRFAVAD